MVHTRNIQWEEELSLERLQNLFQYPDLGHCYQMKARWVHQATLNPVEVFFAAGCETSRLGNLDLQRLQGSFPYLRLEAEIEKVLEKIIY